MLAFSKNELKHFESIQRLIKVLVLYDLPEMDSNLRGVLSSRPYLSKDFDWTILDKKQLSSCCFEYSNSD